MKLQWSLLLGLLFAIIIAIFAVYNVEAVPVDYVFGTAEWPLILVILGSALLGSLISGMIAMYRSFVLARKVKQLEKELKKKDTTIETLQNNMVAYEEKRTIEEDTVQPDENTANL